MGDWGVFAAGNVGGDAGLGEGFSASLESGVGLTAGNSLSAPVNIGGYSSYGFLGGGPYGSATVQGVSGTNNNASLGLAGGVSYGLMFTNATQISQLEGVSQSHNLNLGIGSINWSVSADGIWTVSLTVGAKPVVSFSTYPTETKTITAITSASIIPANTHTACGALCQ